MFYGGNMERLYGKYVGSSLESIEKHNLNELGISPKKYLEIGDYLTQGKQGKFNGKYNSHSYTAVVNGKVCEPASDGKGTEVFGLLRSVRRGI